MNLIRKIKSRIVYLGLFRSTITFHGKTRVLLASLIIQIPKIIRKRAQFIDRFVSWLIKGILMNGLGSQFYIGGLGNLDHIKDSHEKDIQDWFKIRDDETFIDIGANIGKYTVILAKKAKKVYAFEPFPEIYEYLVKNININKLTNVHPHRSALWNKEEFVKFHIKISSEINSIVNPENARYTITVPAFPLDYFKISQMHLVKIDVEGAEKEVLMGMAESLKIHRPRLIIESRNENTEWINKYILEFDYYLAARDQHPNYENLFYLPKPIPNTQSNYDAA